MASSNGISYSNQQQPKNTKQSSSKKLTQSGFYKEHNSLIEPQIVHTSLPTKSNQIMIERPHTSLAIGSSGSELNSSMFTHMNSSLATGLNSSQNTAKGTGISSKQSLQKKEQSIQNSKTKTNSGSIAPAKTST